jgi:hypothetical protein
MEERVVSLRWATRFQVEVFLRIFRYQLFASQAHVAVTGVRGQPAIRRGPGIHYLGRGLGVRQPLHKLLTMIRQPAFFCLFYLLLFVSGFFKVF